MAFKISCVNTDAALTDARDFADQILHPEPSSGSSHTTTVHHDHYHWGSPFWGWGYYPQPAYYGGGSPSSSSRERNFSWVAIIAAPIALGSMYFMGQNHAEWSQAKHKLSKLQSKQMEVQTETSSYLPLQQSMQSVFSKQMQILDQMRNRAANGLLFKGVFLASVVAAGIGGLVSSLPLLGTATAGAFLTGCAMLYRTGFRSQDITLQEDARDLKTAVRSAEHILNLA